MRHRNQCSARSARIAVTSTMILALAGGPWGASAAGKDEPPATASAEFLATMNLKAEAKPRIMKAAKELLEQRYDLSERTDPTVRMSGGKPVPVGPTARLPKGISWERCSTRVVMFNANASDWI